MGTKQGFWMLLLAVIIMLALTHNAQAAWGTSEVDTEKVAITFARELERGGYKTVSTEELMRWIDWKKDMLVVDTMPYEASYKKQHIPGAMQIEFPIPEMTQMDNAMKANLEKLLGSNKDRTIVFYCGFVKCTRSHNAAMWAVKIGYINVYRQPGGIKAWTDAGYPVEKVK